MTAQWDTNLMASVRRPRFKNPSNTQQAETKLGFTTQPSDTAPTVAMSPSVVVAVQDANGTTVGSATDNVTLAIGTDPSSGGATLSGTLTQAAASGLATFNNLSIDSAFKGYTFTASATGLTGATSSGFTITTWYPNQPSSFSTITERSFETTSAEAGWTNDTDGHGHMSIVSDPTAPRSPQNVGQADYPVGWSLAGNDPIDTHIGVTAFGYGQLYNAFWVKLSAGWTPGPGNVNKVGFVWCASNPRVFFDLHGGNAAALTPIIQLQGIPGGNRQLTQNQNTVTIAAGNWVFMESLLQMNSAGNSNGTCRWWVNKTLCGSFNDVSYVANAESHVWGAGGDGVSWKPVLGGSAAGSLATEQMMFMDEWFISGAA